MYHISIQMFFLRNLINSTCALTFTHILTYSTILDNFNHGTLEAVYTMYVM